VQKTEFNELNKIFYVIGNLLQVSFVWVQKRLIALMEKCRGIVK